MKSAFIFILLAIILTARSTLADVSTVVINEILACNDKQLEDPTEPGEFPDWFELYNNSDFEVNLSNMYLSDKEDKLTKWEIPENTIIEAHGFLLFYADNDDNQGNMHTNFKLNRHNGFIALTDTDGITTIDSFSYKNQTKNISYGRFPDGNNIFDYFKYPSPESENTIGKIEDVVFSEKRGFYDQPIMLTLTTIPATAEIYYTIDGSEPLNNIGNGTLLYTSPISVSTTTCVRAKARLAGWKSTETVTHSYIFLDDVLRQPQKPDGFPNNWGHTGVGDYEMDPDVVDDPAYSKTIKDDMKAVPTISLVMDVDNWFGENGQGIYLKGELDERAVSAELINPDGTPGFQVNCSVMIVGGSSVKRWKMDKLSMRLKFKKQYGTPNLKYPLFGDKTTDKFNTLVLDAQKNNTWAYGDIFSISRRPLKQNDIAQYTRDQFVADLQNEMGGFAPHGRYVHLYLNGLYWGIYWLHERPDEHFAAAYLGGKANDYDVIKHDGRTIVNESNTTYQEMCIIAIRGLSSEEQFNSIQKYLDIPNLIDYIILNFFVGNTDWGFHNWYASRHRTDPSHRWRFHSWDAERVMEGLDDNVTGEFLGDGPTFFHQKLTENPIYRKMFGNRLYELTKDGGILTPAHLKALYMVRLNDVDRAVVGESARWGDNRREVPYTKNVEWAAERDWILNTYLEQRPAIVFRQLKQKGLFPLPLAVDGISDLKDWDFEIDGNLDLKGKWKFVWLESEPDFSQPEYNDEAWEEFSVPGYWNNRTGEKYGYGWFRLELKNIMSKDLGLYLMHTNSCYRLYVNGMEIMANGIPGRSREDSIPRHLPLFAELPDSDSLVIAMLVANYDDVYGGLPFSPKIGLKQKIQKEIRQRDIGNIFVIGIICIVAFLHLGICLGRKKDKANLFFFFFCLTIMIRTFILQHFASRLFSGLYIYDILTRIELLTIPLGTFFLLLFYLKLFPTELFKRIPLFLAAMNIIISVITIILPTWFSVNYSIVYQIILFLSSSWILFTIVRETLRKNSNAFIILPVFLFLCIAVGFDSFNVYETSNLVNLEPIATIIFILAQSIILFLRSIMAFIQTKHSAENLQ